MSARDDLVTALMEQGLSSRDAAWAVANHPDLAPILAIRDSKKAAEAVIDDLGGTAKIKALRVAGGDSAERVREDYTDRARARQAEAQAKHRAEADARKSAPADPATYDTNKDGQITGTEVQAATEGGVSGDLLADYGSPGASLDSRGAPLWPYDAPPDVLDALDVADQSSMGQIKESFAARLRQMTPEQRELLGVSDETLNAYRPGRTGARYFERDTLEPLKWSPEQRADLQRLMYGIGLYGKRAKVRLGSWSSVDQQVYKQVLARANVDGLTWREILARWKVRPPEDLLAQINESEGGGPRPPVQVTSPMDIMRTSEAVSQDLIGRVDRSFVESTVAPFQGLEAGARNAEYDAAPGQTITQAPNPASFAEFKLREEKPVEVDGYQFLTQFQTFLDMLGAG